MIHLILVRFNSNVLQELPLSILRKFDSINIVWTSDCRGQFLDNPNECFEFSGYQEGLSRLLYSLRKTSDAGNADYHAVVFANDTIFTGHLACMGNFMINSLVNLSIQQRDLCAVTGLVMPISDRLQTLTGKQSYFSSWLFMIEGTPEELGRIRFYPKGLQIDSFFEQIEPHLPLPYRKSIEEWLHPTSLMGGWYKASIGRDLSLETVRRKRFSIYLELSLSNRLQSQGFSRFCISERIGFFSQVALKILRLLDRIYVNLVKFSLRYISRGSKRSI